MELRQAILERRSIRKFSSRPVERALLEDLLNTSLWAPSGMNRQPWKFLVLEGESLNRLLKLSSNLAEPMDEPVRVFNDKMRNYIKGYFRDLGGAKTVVVCLSKKADTHLADHTNIISCSAALYNFLLLAHEAGLATCWMTGYDEVEEKLMRILGVSGYTLVGVTPVGYPDQAPPTPPRKGEEITWMT